MSRKILLFVALGFYACEASAAPKPLPKPIVLMWQVLGDNPADEFKTLKDLGVNTVQAFHLKEKPAAYVESYLRAAEAADMAVIVFIGPQMEGSGDKCNVPETGKDFIRRYGSSTAIVAWHSADEPALREVSKQCQIQLYSQIKALDADRPVFLSTNFARQSEYDQYFTESAFDILDLHRYVNPDISMGQRNLIELFKRNHTRSYPVIVTLRAFNAPLRAKRMDLGEGDLKAQYQYFFKDVPVTQNIGFYGWDLTPSVGLTKLPALRTEFEQVMRDKIHATR